MSLECFMTPESKEMLLNAGEGNGGMSRGHRGRPVEELPDANAQII